MNAGIKTTQLDALRTRINSDENLHVDFSCCITLYKDFVKQSAQTTNVQLGIAAVMVNDSGRGKVRIAGTLLTSGMLSLMMNRLQSKRLVLTTRRKRGGRLLRRAALSRAISLALQSIFRKKRQLATMHAAAKSSKDAAGDAMESDSGSEGDQRKHSTLTCLEEVPRKDR